MLTNVRVFCWISLYLKRQKRLVNYKLECKTTETLNFKWILTKRRAEHVQKRQTRPDRMNAHIFLTPQSIMIEVENPEHFSPVKPWKLPKLFTWCSCHISQLILKCNYPGNTEWLCQTCITTGRMFTGHEICRERLWARHLSAQTSLFSLLISVNTTEPLLPLLTGPYY